MTNAANGEKKSVLARLSAGKNGKLAIILTVALIGVGLIVFGGAGGSGGGRDSSRTSESFSRYAAEVEEKVCALCSKVEGVSGVRAAVSFECGFEYVYAQEKEAGKYLVVGSGSSESAVRVTEKMPTISGIGIVCRGGGDPLVQSRLINLLSAAFGVGSNKIYITEAAK